MAPGLGPALPAKAAFKPGVEMRKLHWSTVSAGDVSGTLWGEVSDENVLAEGDFTDFEQAFGAAAPVVAVGGGGGAGGGKGGRSSGGGGSKKKSAEDEDKVTFVDPKRSFNLDITLSRFRITYDQIRDALLACDESVLTEEKVDALLKFAPQPDETKALKHFKGDPTKLGKAEQYLRIVSTIPRLTERLELFLFKLQYPDLTAGIEKALSFVDQARLQLKDSQHLKTVLKIVLAFGNYMNSGTRNGQAYGFQLETLTKLRGAKSADGASNLLNFLVQHIQKKSPEVSSFVTDLSAVKTACRVESAHVAKQVQRVSKHLKQLHKEIKKAEELEAAGTTQPGDRFLIVMREFYSAAQTKSKSLEQRQTQLEHDCAELSAFFGAKHLPKWEDLFTIFDDFLNDFQSAERFLEAVRIREEAKARREAASSGPLSQPTRGRTQSEGASGSSALSLKDEMEKRRSALGGAGLPNQGGASSPQPTIPEDGVELGDDSDWDSDS
jgi:dishevelled associated activator of morphogenesis